MRQVRHVTNIAGIMLVGIGLYYFALHVEQNECLSRMVVPPNKTQLPQWLDLYRRWTMAIIAAAAAAALIWYLFAQCLRRENDWTAAGKRPVWWLLLILPAICIVLASVFTPYPKEGGWLGYLFFTLNGLLCYYITTLCFSPTSSKFDPPGAEKIRYW